MIWNLWKFHIELKHTNHPNQAFLIMYESNQSNKFNSRCRRCIDFPENCSLSGKSCLCTRQNMFFHVLKIPTERMIRIVEKYNLSRFPRALGRYTLANVITDYTKQDFADEIMNGEN